MLPYSLPRRQTLMVDLSKIPVEGGVPVSAKIHFSGDSNLGPRGGKLYVFHCPGCKHSHRFEVDAPNGTGWKWNGSLEKPTFTPSLLVAKDMPGAWCHSFVIDGRIQFLGDCFHALAGQTVELPNWDEEDSGF